MSLGLKILAPGVFFWLFGYNLAQVIGSSFLYAFMPLLIWGPIFAGLYLIVADLRRRGRSASDLKRAPIASDDTTSEDRAKRCAEVLSLMNDDAAIAIFNAGAVMSDDQHRDLRRVIDREASTPQNLNMQGGVNAYAVGSVVGHAIGRGIGNLARNLSTGRYANDVSYSCAVGNISDSNRQLLRITAILMKHGLIEQPWLENALAGVIFQSGNKTVYQTKNRAEQRVLQFTILPQMLETYLVNENILQQEIVPLAASLRQDGAHSAVGQELAKLTDGGAAWLGRADIPDSIYNPSFGKGLFLGLLEDGTPLSYDGEGSLFTIAPPGAGKSRCQVIPNLLMYDGPAIVLDIKGECYADTAGYRSRAHGKVIRFAPYDKENSACYNPLDFVRSDPEFLASDARKMADMLVVPTGKAKDPYWENKGRDILAAYIAYVALKAEDHERNMKSVMDMMSPTPDMLKNAIENLQATGITYLVRLANQIQSMPDKQRESVMDVARSHLSAWDLGDLDDVTAHCDWKPEDFRSTEQPLTLYLCVLPEDIDRFASVLRVIIGQHLEHFMKELPGKVERPIVFFLDEAPQLGNFAPLPKAASLGRQYGLQLWLFAQNRNQIEIAYDSADTILGNSVIQCWMNCDEDAAAKLERNLGVSRGLLDGKEKPLVQSHQLRGPEYEDKIIVVGRGQKPAKLHKHMVFNDEALSKLIGLDINSGSGAVAVENIPSADDTVQPQPVEVDGSEPIDTSPPS